MGTTLQNGVYLPNEGERNCYAGLKTNWEILDQKVADVTALQQAVAGALHREIVVSLPTTDIDPNTIYMILSGTSATENVYDEYMYVNNAWELIGTSATDLTNYYTKGDVDGLLLLKANASDLTSHTGDTTIHVTASDKSKWNTVALIKQLRLVNAQVGSATTIAFANIDDTNGIKVGDKCMDLDAKMFEITAVDTTNQTVTVGSALIDLALDANVVHTSGNETVGGQKTFSDNLSIYNADNSVDTPRLNIKTSKYVKGDTTNTDTMRINFLDSNGNSVASVYANKNTSGSQYLSFQIYTTDNNDANITSTINYYISKSGDKYFIPYEDNQIGLGGTVRRWKSVYATNYYYGANNVEFSTKFVTTDTAQTISGTKTFTDNNMIKTSSPKVLLINTSQTGNTAPSSNTASFLRFDGGTVNNFGGVQCEFLTTGENRLTNYVKDITTAKLNTIQQRASSTTAMTMFNADLLAPANDGVTALGSNSKRWSDCQTKLINGLTPSSLSLPSDRSARIDISGYFTNTANGDTNTYTVPVNGWIYLNLNDVVVAHCFAQTADNLSHYGQTFARASAGQLHCLFPVRKDDVFVSQWYTTTTVTVTNAYFIPCLGNI